MTTMNAQNATKRNEGLFLGIPYNDAFEFHGDFDKNVLKKQGYGGKSEICKKLREAVMETTKNLKNTLSKSSCEKTNSLLKLGDSYYLVSLNK